MTLKRIRGKNIGDWLPQSMVADLLILNRENSGRSGMDDSKLEIVRMAALERRLQASYPAAAKDFAYRASLAADFFGTEPPNLVSITKGSSLSSMYLEAAGFSILSVSVRMTGFNQKMKDYVVGHEMSHKAHRDGLYRKAVFRTHEALAIGAGVYAASLGVGGYSGIADVAGRMAAHPFFANTASVAYGILWGATVGYGVYLSRVPVSRAIDRRHELRADIDGIRFAGSALAMVQVAVEEFDSERAANTLGKMLRDRKGAVGVSGASSGLCGEDDAERMEMLKTLPGLFRVVDAFVNGLDRLVARLYSTHPSVERRIRNALGYAARTGMRE